MTITTAKKNIISATLCLYDERESANIAILLIEWITGWSRTNQLMNRDTTLTPDQQISINAAIERLTTGEPIQYIIEKAWFMGMPFAVNSSTLIPRPETEELVNWVLTDLTQQRPRILEIGTGTGCIPISLKLKQADAQLTAIDISATALATAHNNALALEARIDFMQLDFLDETNWMQLGHYDMIVSNPPYIRLQEKETMHQNVVGFEPHLALFVPDHDPLIFYRKIHAFAQQHLAKNGSIYLEINEALATEVTNLFDNGYKVECRKDLQGKDRMVRAVKK
ncbi:MAG: peptide chain release factor N(5)-glutamine methyltransferase [Sphingobacteriia bacterium]|nr:MAG: peptide chain release factor N(5)-glutamine methyltransferase [Sphingobacteriia bacterium]TAG30037.1 MAG: peptide chain release factor N(5)-glutamine methyltransferase [Sphingobacteriia bacterium]